MIETAPVLINHDDFPARIGRRDDLVDILDALVDEYDRDGRILLRRIACHDGIGERVGRLIALRIMRLRAARIAVVRITIRGCVRRGIGCLLAAGVGRLCVRRFRCRRRRRDRCCVERNAWLKRPVRYAGREAAQQLIDTLLLSIVDLRRTHLLVHDANPNGKTAPACGRNKGWPYCDIYSFLKSLFPAYNWTIE